MTADEANDLIEGFYDLRNRCYELARENDGALMGNDAWLRHALDVDSMLMFATSDGIEIMGRCRSMQTMDTENYQFMIPYERL